MAFKVVTLFYISTGSICGFQLHIFTNSFDDSCPSGYGMISHSLTVFQKMYIFYCPFSTVRYVHMFCEYMCACVLMYLNIRGLYQAPSSIAFHLIFFGTGTLTESELTDWLH